MGSRRRNRMGWYFTGYASFTFGPVCVCVSGVCMWVYVCLFVFGYVMIYHCQDVIRSVLLVGVLTWCLAMC